MLIKNKQIEKIDGRGLRVGVVGARFNREITEKILASALKALRAAGVKSVKVFHVAGSVELPVALNKLAASGKYDCLVALGAVIRGETTHFDHVCKMAQEGILAVMLRYGIPIGFGVLTTENTKQARARTDIGGRAARAALEVARLKP